MNPVQDGLIPHSLLLILDGWGTDSGLYRDAVAYLCADYAIRGSTLSAPPGAMLQIRAKGRLVRILPVSGFVIESENADGDWEPISTTRESVAGSGRRYRVGGRDDFFFEFRV